MPSTDGDPIIGDCVGGLRICLTANRVFDATFTYQVSGVDTPWPDDTQGRLVFNWGTGTDLIVAGTVDSQYLRFHLEPDQTELVPKGSTVTIEMCWDGNPDHWRPWRRGRVECSS
jgi:hypothetical protein